MKLAWAQPLRRCTDNLLISITVCFIIGASTAYTFSAPLAPLPLATLLLPFLLVLALAAYCLPPRLRPLSALPLFFCIGLLHTHSGLQPEADSRSIARVITEKTRATVVGRILTMVEYDGEKTRFELGTEEILLHDMDKKSSLQPVRGKIQLAVQGDLSGSYIPGMKIMAIAMIDHIRDYQTPGAFPYRIQMATKAICCSGWVRSAKEILQVHEPPLSFGQRLRFFPEQVRQRVALFLNQQFTPEIAGLYQALLIGSMVNISPQLVEAFKENGCFHVLSISGLHLSLLGLFAVTILTLLLKRSQWLLLHTHVPTLALVLTAPLLLLYTFIAGMNIPAFRSLVTALLVLFAVVLRRQRSLIHLITAAALIVLAITPLALFTASFQLSFGAVLAINCIYPRLPLVITKPESNPSPDRIRKGLMVLQSMIYVSLAATAGTLPFLLYHFNRFSLIGPVMNLIIEPLLCLWAMPCGLLAIPLIGIAPGLSTLLFKIGSPGIQLTVWLAEAFAGFPYASIWTITPTFLEIILFFVILFLFLREQQTIRQLSLALTLSLILLASFTLGLWLPNKKGELIVSFLDVGQGSSTLLQLPNGKNILIDGGGYQTERFDTGHGLIAPFLWRNRIWRLDDLIISHPHKDHYNGLPFVYERFQPQRLIINGDNGDEPAYGQFLETVRKKGTPIQVAMVGDTLQQGDSLRLECLGMNGTANDLPTWSTNDRSLVLRLQFGKRSFLFPGDISTQSEDRLMLHHGRLPRADVLLAPHHGSITSAGQEFMAAVSPGMIVVSTSLAGLRTQSTSEHIKVWQEENIPTGVTTSQGTITSITNGNVLRTSSFKGDVWVLDEKEERSIQGK